MCCRARYSAERTVSEVPPQREKSPDETGAVTRDWDTFVVRKRSAHRLLLHPLIPQLCEASREGVWLQCTSLLTCVTRHGYRANVSARARCRAHLVYSITLTSRAHMHARTKPNTHARPSAGRSFGRLATPTSLQKARVNRAERPSNNIDMQALTCKQRSGRLRL